MDAWRRSLSAILALTLLLGAFAAFPASCLPAGIVIADDRDYPPFVFLDSTGEPRGIIVDIWRLWSDKTGIAVEFRLMEWEAALASVREGRADAVGGLFRTPERDALFEYSQPYAEISTAIFFHHQIGGVRGIQDLAGFRIGVVRGDSAEELLRTSHPGLIAVGYPGIRDLVEAAVAGEVRVFIADTPAALYYLSRHQEGSDFRQASPPLAISALHAAVRKGDAELLAVVHGGFEQVSETEILQIMEDWAGNTPVSRVWWMQIAIGFGGLAALLVGVSGWNMLLRRRVRDKTAELEASLQASAAREEQFRLLIEHQSDLVVKVDLQGRFLYVSPSYCRTFGRSETELLGKAFMPMVHEDDLPSTTEAMKALFEPPHTAYMEQRAMTVEGWRWLAWNDSAVLGPAGEIREIIGVGRDITERKVAEELLRQSEERFAKAFHSSPAPLVISDIESGRFIDVNARWVEMLGFSREDQIGRTSKDVGIWSDPGQRDRAVEILRRQGFFKEFPIEFVTKDGDTRSALWSAEIVSLQGRDVLLSLIYDYTERRKVEEALRESESRYRSVIDNIQDVYYRTDANGLLIMISPSGVRLLGYGSEDEMLGRHNETFWFEPARRKDFIDLLRARGRVSDHEVTLKRKDGQPVLVATSSNLYFDGQGGLLGVEGIFRDIAERKKAEEALRASEEKFRSIVESLPMGMHFYRLAADGRLLLDGANPAADRMLGVDHAALRGKTIEEAFPGLAGSTIPEMYRNVARGQLDPQFFETQYHDDRFSGFYAVTVFRIGADAAATAYLDITDRRRSEELLRQSEEKFSRLFRLSPDAISLSDPDSGRIVEVNDAFVRLTGYGQDELAGRVSTEVGLFVRTSDRERMLARLRETGQANDVELEIRRKDGSAIPCSVSCQFVTIGQKRFLLAVTRDLTDFRRMQEMMIQSEKMISVGGIAAGIAHEINNPLGIIVQAAQNLELRTRPDFPRNVEAAEAIGLDMALLEKYMRDRKVLTFVQDMRSAALRAAEIIRHMLDFSRRSESRRKVCHLPDIIDRAVELAQSDYDLKKSYDFKRIAIVRDYDDDLRQIDCTETEIEQVLLNLLRNAAQAMAQADPPRQDPRIVLRASNVPHGVRIEVQDNGPGMPSSLQRRVFEPFFTTKPPGVGTGLGLSVSYFIVTSGHAGSMWVESEQGTGSKFVVELPANGSRDRNEKAVGN